MKPSRNAAGTGSGPAGNGPLALMTVGALLVLVAFLSDFADFAWLDRFFIGVAVGLGISCMVIGLALRK